jgi:hypothetical protein
MKSVTTERFRKAFDELPEHIKEQANKSFKVWTKNPNHPAIHFKRIHKTKLIYSVRITLSYRALGIKENDTMIWFWIGSHTEYDKLISSL